MVENEKNMPVFAELELVFSKYFDKHLAGVVDRVQKAADAAADAAAKKVLDERMRAVGPVANDAVVMSQITHAVQVVKAKTSAEKVLSGVQQTLFNDLGRQADLQKMIKLWRAAAIAQIGEKDYERYSVKVGGDLADKYVAQRLNTLIMERLATNKNYKSELEYIFKEGLSDSLAGFLYDSISQNHFESTTEEVDEIRARYEAMVKDKRDGSVSSFARVSANLLSIITDGVTVPGAGTAKMFTWDMGLRTVNGILGAIVSDDVYTTDFDEQVGDMLFVDKKSMKKLREAAPEYDYAGNKDLEKISSMLDRPIVLEHLDQRQITQKHVDLLMNTSDDVRKMRDGIIDLITSDDRFRVDVPSWMNKQSLTALQKNAKFFADKASSMKKDGKSVLLVGDKRYTYDEVVLRARQYDRAVFERTPGSALTQSYSLKGAGQVSLGTKPPAWMQKQTLDKLTYNASYFTSLAFEMREKRNDKVRVGDGGKVYTYAEVCQRALDYANAAVQRQGAQRQRVREQQAVSGRQEAQRMAAYSSQQYQQYQQPVTPQYQQMPTGGAVGQGAPQYMSASYGSTGAAQPLSDVSCWDQLMNASGLKGLGGLFKNFGYTIAMLPDLLLGMLNGKGKGMKLDDNLLPLGAIVCALLFGRRNPMLKFLLLAFGGVGILNNANKALHGGQSQSATRVYDRVPDRALDPRIRNVSLDPKSGRMLMDVDGHPVSCTISGHSLEAYQKGVLPLNALCNEVLAKFDEQGGLQGLFARQEQEAAMRRGLEESRQERSIGIR